MTPSVFAHTKLDFFGMIRFFVVSFTVVILNAALAILSDKGLCVRAYVHACVHACVCLCVWEGACSTPHRCVENN